MVDVGTKTLKTDEVLLFYLVKFWMILLVSTLWSWQGFGGVSSEEFGGGVKARRLLTLSNEERIRSLQRQ